MTSMSTMMLLDANAKEADMVIFIKNGRVFVFKDREEGTNGEASIGDLIGRLLREEAGQPGVFSGKF